LTTEIWVKEGKKRSRKTYSNNRETPNEKLRSGRRRRGRKMKKKREDKKYMRSTRTSKGKKMSRLDHLKDKKGGPDREREGKGGNGNKCGGGGQE